jgi:hypothetical protein
VILQAADDPDFVLAVGAPLGVLPGLVRRIVVHDDDLEVLDRPGERLGAFVNEVLNVAAFVEGRHHQGDAFDLVRARRHW